MNMRRDPGVIPPRRADGPSVQPAVPLKTSDWYQFSTIEAKALRRFHEALTEYGYGAADETGLAGQWADIHRKVRKLKRAMWEGDATYLTRETVPEILEDLIGHCLLALEMIERGANLGRSGSPHSSSPSSPSTSDSGVSTADSEASEPPLGQEYDKRWRVDGRYPEKNSEQYP